VNKRDADDSHSSTKKRISLPVACLLFSAAMVLAFPAFAAFGFSRSGGTGVAAAAVAGGVCWAGALTALLLMGALRSGPKVVYATLLGTFFRLGVPLIAGLALNYQGGLLAEAGVFGMIVGYYLVGLIVETLLSVRLVGNTTGGIARAS